MNKSNQNDSGLTNEKLQCRNGAYNRRDKMFWLNFSKEEAMPTENVEVVFNDEQNLMRLSQLRTSHILNQCRSSSKHGIRLI
ncbi:hypothetical protein T07_14575 [Trichinella nelsoni]|uniref:Uncharacterized protein n=1 Tax=Trichinella nelsoni TaxID=6336 RepID=A0A0V0RUD4_9BILA|nr:hypothetical protein T07_14575 [Trichinella nelsoni]